MDLVNYIIRSFLFPVILVEILGAVFVVWSFYHEEKLIEFEDKLLHVFRVLRCKLRKRLFVIVRNTFIVCYGEVRRLRVKRCRRVLSRYGMKAVRSNSEFGARHSEG